MLIQRSDEVRTEIAALARLRRIAQEAEGYRTRATQLREPLQALEFHIILLEEFRRRGLEVAFDTAEVGMLKGQIAQLAAAYHADPASILPSAGKSKYTLWEPLRELPGKLASALMATWSGYVRSRLPVEHGQLLASLEHIPSFSGQVGEIRRLYREAEIIQSRLPRGPSEIDAVARIEQALTAAWQCLQGEGIPNSVVEFLQLAATGQATLRHVSAEVADWVARHGLQDTFRVGLRSMYR
jgi:hypothetical protein